jgi:hypothetical protein
LYVFAVLYNNMTFVVDAGEAEFPYLETTSNR